MDEEIYNCVRIDEYRSICTVNSYIDLSFLRKYSNIKTLKLYGGYFNVLTNKPNKPYENFCKYISGNIKNLAIEIFESTISPRYDFKDLPKTLEELEIINGDFNEELDDLPNGLKKLVIQTWAFDKSLKNLPANLSVLKILNYRFVNNPILTQFNSDVNNLPIELKELDIEGEIFNKSLEYLPIGIKTVRINSDAFNQPLNNLPHSIELLYIVSKNLSLENCETLIVPIKCRILEIKVVSKNYENGKIVMDKICEKNKQLTYKLLPIYEGPVNMWSRKFIFTLELINFTKNI